MKVNILQPAYSMDYEMSDKYFYEILDMLDKCTAEQGIVVMPEYCDVPCYASNSQKHFKSYEKYNKILLDKCKATAKRLNCVLFVNAGLMTESGLRNATYAIDRNGQVAGHYFKQHLTDGEKKKGLDNSYNLEYDLPKIIVIDGIRYAFLTCYDFYFYELLPMIARQKPDIIIGCSHQRSDMHSALDMMTKFAAYNCNCFVLRSSVSMGTDKTVGGMSMVVAPNLEVLLSMGSKVGIGECQIQPLKKYLKPAGFNNPLKPHYEYAEVGRSAWKYRHSGSSVVLNDDEMPYPRICAHRGFNSILPENSMAAFGAAIALGAQEIELDLRFTKDGEIVVCHDENIDMLSNGKGDISSYDLKDLLSFDFGINFSESFKGLSITLFEDVLKKFACKTIMNLHIKSNAKLPYGQRELEKIVYLLHKYDCEKHVYIASDDNFLKLCKDLAPHIKRCCLIGNKPHKIVERALKNECHKLQFFKQYVNAEIIKKARGFNLKCNLFYTDNPLEIKEFLDMGIDTILTNDFHNIYQRFKELV